ncbi:hypothetical protein BH10CHL1_BH10CHL1_39650 [soil metagenome]
MAYRVVTPDRRRLLALCRLTSAMQIVPGSVVPFSDSIQAGGDWHADARFCIFRDRLFIHYNDGYRKPNHIYLVEVDPDTLAARGPARVLVLDGPQRAVEKNWMLFAHDDELWAIYSICPHVVLRLSWGEVGSVVCQRAYQHAWDATAYALPFGELRGGAPPVRLGDQYVSFFHSSFLVHPLRRLLFKVLRKRPTNILHYVGGVYGFAAKPPFTPLWLQPTPILMPPSLPRHHAQLSPIVEYSAYPCGAVLQNQRWILSFGARNEYCCLATSGFDAIPGESTISIQATDLTQSAVSNDR